MILGETRRELSRLPLVLRCVVVAGCCTGAIAAVITVINVIATYPADDVVQASLFGIIEAFVLAGVAGSVLGLVIGVVSYLSQKAIRALR